MSASTQDSPRARWAPWIEGALLACAVAAILAFSGDVVRASYHGFTHVAIGEAVLRDGLTPENPYHAGAPLRYYTLFPALGVALGRLGCGPLWGFVLLNVLSALLFAPALDALGRALSLSFGARRAAFLAAVFGFNGLGWIGFSFAEVSEAVRTPVYALAPMTFARESFGWDPRLQAFLPKFLNVSSYALALPFALWSLAFAVSRERESGARAWRAGACIGVATALNPLVGGLAGACAGVCVLPALIRAPTRERAHWLSAGVLAVVIALPFLLPAFARAPDGPELFGNPPLGGTPLSNLIGPLLVLLVPAVLGWRALSPRARWCWSVPAAVTAVLVLLGEMPQGNEYKMARLLGLFVAIPAGVWLAQCATERGLRRAIPWVLLLACVPTTLAVPRAYARFGASAGKLPLTAHGGRLAVDDTVVKPPIPASVVAAEASADPRAVAVLALHAPGSRGDTGVVQGHPLAPSLSRALFVDVPQIHNDGQPDLRERLSCVRGLWEGRTWAASGRGDELAPSIALARLRSTLPDRPFVFFVHASTPGVRALLEREGARVLADSGGYAWILLDPQVGTGR